MMTSRTFSSTPLHRKTPVPADIEIAQEATLKPITQVAEELGLLPDEIELYGPYKAKVKLEVLERLKDTPSGKYVDVTAINANTIGGRQNNHNRRSEPGIGGTLGQTGDDLHPPTQPGTDLWHQRRSGWRRLQPDNSDGGFQPAFDRRHSCHYGG